MTGESRCMRIMCGDDVILSDTGLKIDNCVVRITRALLYPYHDFMCRPEPMTSMCKTTSSIFNGWL